MPNPASHVYWFKTSHKLGGVFPCTSHVYGKAMWLLLWLISPVSTFSTDYPANIPHVLFVLFNANVIPSELTNWISKHLPFTVDDSIIVATTRFFGHLHLLESRVATAQITWGRNAAGKSQQGLGTSTNLPYNVDPKNCATTCFLNRYPLVILVI